MPSHSLLIEAEPAVCFAEITDHETFPEWQSAVKDRDVRFTIDAKSTLDS